MKRNIIILILCYIATALMTVRCVKASNPPVDELLAEFLSTRASAPLESTIWEHQTQDGYNRYISFREGTASLFYGRYEDGELQRWSDFYTSPYLFIGNGVETALTYPKWGENERAYSITIIRSGDGYTISAGGEEYTYFSPYTEDIEGQWMLIIAEPAPWD